MNPYGREPKDFVPEVVLCRAASRNYYRFSLWVPMPLW
jgi:hypothetical protein